MPPAQPMLAKSVKGIPDPDKHSPVPAPGKRRLYRIVTGGNIRRAVVLLTGRPLIVS